MARSSISLLVSICYLFTLASTLSRPASSPGSTLTLAAANAQGNSMMPFSNSSESKWHIISSNGSRIVAINRPEDKPNNTTSKLPAYEWQFSNPHGSLTPLPGLARFLFYCARYLVDEVPASALGVETPYPQGKYVCELGRSLPGSFLMSRVDNKLGWNMTYSDLAFLMGAIFEGVALEPEAPSFDVEFKYCKDVLVSWDLHTVAKGQWISDSGGDAATSAR